MSAYKGADIVKTESGWWIAHDGGEAGPFASYEDASIAATCQDDDRPMEGSM